MACEGWPHVSFYSTNDGEGFGGNYFGTGESVLKHSLFLQKGPARVLLDPIAFDVPGSDAVVDLYLMPAYDDLASLYLAGGEWTIHYPLPASAKEAPFMEETKSRSLNEITINEILDSIAAHAESSI